MGEVKTPPKISVGNKKPSKFFWYLVVPCMCFLVMVHIQMRLVYFLHNTISLYVKKINTSTLTIAVFVVIMMLALLCKNADQIVLYLLWHYCLTKGKLHWLHIIEKQY